MQFNNSTPIYLQIFSYICDLILDNKIKCDEQIPSIRELSINLGVNQNTVLKSYNILKDSNIIYEKRGLGLFVTHSSIETIKKIKQKDLEESILPNFFKTIFKNSISPENLKNLYSTYLEEHKNEKK